jgi:hypothetical protein
MSEKFLISYLGGSGGDFFCNSCNGVYKKHYKISIDNKATLKKIEDKKNKFQIISTIKRFNHKFITTHLFEEVLYCAVPVISIIFKKNEIKEKVILRQMQLKRLRLKVANNEDIFNLIKKLCINNNYNKAAKLYFEFNKDLWLKKHQTKVDNKYKTFKNLYFDELFSSNFCDSIKKQQWNVNLKVLKTNHINWLKNNNNFTYTNTIDNMSYKFSQMSWHKDNGYVEYVPK